jgi:hypothetical protein
MSPLDGVERVGIVLVTTVFWTTAPIVPISALAELRELVLA